MFSQTIHVYLYIHFKNTILFSRREYKLKSFTAVIERCPETGLYVGYIPGFPGAHSQGKTLDEINANLREVIEMLLEDGEPKFETEFIGIQNVMVG